VEKLKEKLKEILAKKKLTADIYMEENTKTEIQANDGEIEKITKADSFGAGIRVFKNGKMGTGYFTVKDAAEAKKIIDKACETALIQGYENYRMPGPAKAVALKLADPDFSSISVDDLKKSALLLERSARTGPEVKFVRDTQVTSVLTRVNIFNTAGVDSYFEKSLFVAFTGAISVDGNGQEAVEAAEVNALYDKLNVEALGKDCGDRAARLLHGKSLKSGNYDIILPPYVASDFLSLLYRLFLANNIRKGKSLLAKNTKGDVIGSKILNIRDDALLDYGAGSYPVDGEGTAGGNKAVIEAGKLNTFLYDIINAERMKIKSTGNSVRPDFKGLPDCGPSNFYINPGSGKSCGETGILVNSLMGLHMTDTISGNFSLGINGWLVEKGEKKQAVKETLITGNIRDLLMKIDVICSDLKFYGSFGSPTIVARDIAVAGK